MSCDIHKDVGTPVGSICPLCYMDLATQLKHSNVLLKKAIRLLKEGKAKFAPNTTNSTVDDFIKRHGWR